MLFRSGSEIYGGLANSWDYGPLGVELKNNVKRAWWKKFVQENPYNVGLDAAILMNPEVWVASGHVSTFNDPLIDCKACKMRHRADKLIEGWCAENGRDDVNVEAMTNEELAKFSPALAERPQIVVGNKCDLATEEQIDTFRKYVEEKGLTFVPISAATMQGVRELPGLVYNRLKDIPAVPVFAPEYKKPEAKAGGREFTIKRMEAHVWSVDAPWLEYILAGSNVDDYESLQYFQRQLGESGILDALVQKGVQENDTILIGEYQFDYIF